MSTALFVSVGSLVWTTILFFLFLYEDKVGKRTLLITVRKYVDTVAWKLVASTNRLFDWWGTGRVRLFLHFLVHTVLRNFLRIVRRLEQGGESLLKRNKRKAKKIQYTNAEHGSSYLREVAKHKQSISRRPKQDADR